MYKVVEETSMSRNNELFIEAFIAQMEKVIDAQFQSLKNELSLNRSSRKPKRLQRDEISHDYYSPSSQRIQRISKVSYGDDSDLISYQREVDPYFEFKEELLKALQQEQQKKKKPNMQVSTYSGRLLEQSVVNTITMEADEVSDSSQEHLEQFVDNKASGEEKLVSDSSKEPLKQSAQKEVYQL